MFWPNMTVQRTRRSRAAELFVNEVKPKEGAIVLASYVQEYFTNAESGNNALRSLRNLIPQKISPDKKTLILIM